MKDHLYEFGTDGQHMADEYDDVELVHGKSCTSVVTQSDNLNQDISRGKNILKLKKCTVLIKNSQISKAAIKELQKEESITQQERLMKRHPPSDIHPKSKGIMSLSYLEKYKVPQESVCNIVDNLCMFKCDNCIQRFSIPYKTFKVHLKKCKGKQARLTKIHFNEVRYHDCFICGTRMFCDTDVVKAHVTRNHSLTLPQYKKRTVRISSESKISMPIATKLPDMISSEFVQLPSEMFSACLDDVCLFSCDKCSFTTSSWNSMSTHNVKSPHGTGSRKFDVKYVKEAMYHRCILCKRVVYCDNLCLFIHSYKMHKIKLDAYKNMVMSSQKGNTMTAKLTKNNIDNGIKCQMRIVATEKYFKRYQMESDKVPKEYLSDEVGDYCEFVCFRCKHKTQSWKSMQTHILRKHLGVPKVMVFERRYLSEARMHRCRVCSKALYCDRELMRRHLVKQHHITSIAAYEKYYKNNASSNKTGSIRKPELKNNLMAYDRSNGLVFTFTESLGHFYCVDCYYFAQDYVVMRAHVMNTQHGLKEGEKVSRVTIKAAILHECQVCFEKISCFRSTLLEHVTYKHKFKGGLSEYSDNYIVAKSN